MDTQTSPRKSLPLGVKLAGGYLIVAGLFRSLGMLFTATSLRADSGTLSFGMLASDLVRVGMGALILVAGCALFYRKSWSRRFALGALFMVGYSLFKRGALLLSAGYPVGSVLGVFGSLLALTTLLFVLLLRRSAVEALP